MKDELKSVLIEMIKLKTNGKHDEARSLAIKFLKEKGHMAINSLAELKARVPKDEIDFKGRPFLTEERLASDPEINEYFNRTRMNWRKIPHSNSYALHDSITVR